MHALKGGCCVRVQAAQVSQLEGAQQAHESVPTANADPIMTPAANGSDCTHCVLVVRKLRANFEHVGIGRQSVAPMIPLPRLPHH